MNSYQDVKIVSKTPHGMIYDIAGILLYIDDAIVAHLAAIVVDTGRMSFLSDLPLRPFSTTEQVYLFPRVKAKILTELSKEG